MTGFRTPPMDDVRTAEEAEGTWKWAAGSLALFAIGWALGLWWLRGTV